MKGRRKEESKPGKRVTNVAYALFFQVFATETKTMQPKTERSDNIRTS